MRARYFVLGLTGLITAVALAVVTSMIATTVSAKVLRANDSSLSAGQPGQSVRLDVGVPVSLRGGMELRPVDVAVPLANRSLASPAFSVQTSSAQARMSPVPYLGTAAGQIAFAGDDSWLALPADTSALARHMVAHEPQRVISAADSWWLLLVGLMLVTYQLRRKHIFLRPKPFGF